MINLNYHPSKIQLLRNYQVDKNVAFRSYLAFSVSPSLILDEPTVGMDLESIDYFWHFIEKVSGSILVITHDFNQIDKFFSRVLLLKDGQISQDIPVKEIHQHNQTIEQWYRQHNR